MNRLLTALLALLAIGALLVFAAPEIARRYAGTHGVDVQSAGWCETGLCLHGVSAPTLHHLQADHIAIDWDRTVRLVTVTATVGSGTAVSDALPSAPDSGVLAWITRVTVQDLTIPGTPLPALSGELYPSRRLTGEGVTIDGDVAEADVPTPLGALRVRAQRTAAGLAVEASAPSLTLPARLLGEPFTLQGASASGIWDDGHWAGDLRLPGLAIPAVVDPGAATAVLTLEQTSLAQLYDALTPVIPEASRARVLGTVSATVTLSMVNDELDIRIADPRLEGFGARGLITDDLREQFTYPTLDALGAPKARTIGPALPGWISLDRVGPMLPAAIIAAEDATFYRHDGYDLASMVDAFGENTERGEVHRGGSTLTQQLAKNLFLDGTRTYVRKLRELLYAADLEHTLGKRGILETYVNIVEFGPGIYGCLAATDRYFLKSPAGLLPEEAAWLASILPSPRSAWTQQYQRDRPNMARVHGILDNMVTLSDANRAAAKGRAIRFVR